MSELDDLHIQEDFAYKADVAESLNEHAAGVNLFVYKKLESTNDTAAALARKGEPEIAAVIAAEQTKGRGRRGRSFFSPMDTGVYMSLLLRPKFRSEDAALLTPAAAVAAANAIEQTTGASVGIKWVNDIYADGKKVCGILTEAFVLPDGLCAIVGIGINVAVPCGGFPEDIKDKAGAVYFSQDTASVRGRLVAQVINNFVHIYEHFSERHFVNEYRRRLLFLGEEIIVTNLTTKEARHATAVSADNACRLIVRYANGEEEALVSGEISVNLRKP